MTGIEYSLLLVQEPILYIIRKVHRQSPDKCKHAGSFHNYCLFLFAITVVPLAYFYILGGVVYQCPDLHSLLNSRLVSKNDPG